jgi:hypothetical protein
MEQAYDTIWVAFDHWLDDMGLFEQDHTHYKYSAVLLDFILFSIPIVIFFFLTTAFFLVLLGLKACRAHKLLLYVALAVFQISFYLMMFSICFFVAFLVSGHGFTLFHSSLLGILLSTIICFGFFTATFRGSWEIYLWVKGNPHARRTQLKRTLSTESDISLSSPNVGNSEGVDEVDDISFGEKQSKSPLYTHCNQADLSQSGEHGKNLSAEEAVSAYNEYQIQNQKQQMIEMQQLFEGASISETAEDTSISPPPSSSSPPSSFINSGSVEAQDEPLGFEKVLRGDIEDPSTTPTTSSYFLFFVIFLLSLSLSLSLEGVCDAYTPLEYSTTFTRYLSGDLCTQTPCFVYTLLPPTNSSTSMYVVFHSPNSLQGNAFVKFARFGDGVDFEVDQRTTLKR